MGQPVFWSALLAVSVAGVGVRVLARRPLLPRLAKELGRWELAVAGASLLALVFHCLAMFFAGWVDVVPFLRAPAAAIRAMGTVSQVAYWVPAALLLVAVRRVWPIAVAVLAVMLAGVGVTMYWPFALTTHLAWIAAAVVEVVVIASVLVRARPSTTAAA
jgi:hypothetical protein